MKANACDLEERRRRIHAERSLRVWSDVDGVGHLHWRDNPERIATFMAELEPHVNLSFRAAKAAQRCDPLEAHQSDAMVALAAAAGRGCGERAAPARQAKILVRVDLPRLLSDHPVIEGEDTCEIVGYGPVASSVVRDMLDSGDPFLAAVITSGRQVLGVAHLGRKFTAHQQTALEWLYPTCAVEGCNALARLEYDHRADWAHTHLTLLDLADRPCHFHHLKKTLDGWAFVDGIGKRSFVPPDDPRHPKHAGVADPNAPPGAA